MSEKMTSGEIAKKAGVSQKAVRLYDEKGLLKPSDYSEGNYRLYDKESLLILEKIIALKQIGFSLEDISNSLKASREEDIEGALREQVKIMEEKKKQIEQVIRIINGTLQRYTGKLNWDNVAEIIQSIGQDQKLDERHFDALRHTGREMDWYVRIFQSLDLKEEQKVLDLGCGYAKLWRNNWTDIPKGTQIYCYDLHGTWADDFEKFLPEHKEQLPEAAQIKLQFMDVEEADTWVDIAQNAKYDRIIAHYIESVLKEKERFLARVSEALKDGGMFSWNGASVCTWNYYFLDVFSKLGIDSGFLTEKIEEQTAARSEMVELLHRYFDKVEAVTLTSQWYYTDAEDLYCKLLSIYPEEKKVIEKQEDMLKQYFATQIGDLGELVIKTEAEFWHCYK